MPKEKRSQLMKLTVVVTSAILVILTVQIIAGVLISGFYEAPRGAGEFGDMFGGVNAFFSGLAFLGVIFAILLQRRELELQREELEQTRKELAGQKEQLALQNETFRRQAFESAFFQMLSLHHELVNAISVIRSATKHSGRDCFGGFYEELRGTWRGTRAGNVNATPELIEAAYSRLYNRIQKDVSHYFRNLYNIVKFVDRSDVGDKKFYTNLIRAQLSSYELLLLFYNCVTPLGRKKFKPLLERYALLKNLPQEELIDKSHVAWYKPDAYGE